MSLIVYIRHITQAHTRFLFNQINSTRKRQTLVAIGYWENLTRGLPLTDNNLYGVPMVVMLDLCYVFNPSRLYPFSFKQRVKLFILHYVIIKLSLGHHQ